MTGLRATAETLAAAIWGGVLLSAGGSGRRGLETNRVTGELAMGLAPVDIVPLDQFHDHDLLIVATGVGAPGAGKPSLVPRDSIQAAVTLIGLCPKRPVAVIPGHVPGLYAWLQAAALGLAVGDAAGNGRGHPTVRMGGMGLVARPEMTITQVGVGGAAPNRIEVVARGNVTVTEPVLRRAADLNGGMVYAARGPLTIGYAKQHAAPSSISYTIGLGRAMLGAAAGQARIDAAIAYLKGRQLVQGRVVRNTVTYGGGFTCGQLLVEGDGGSATLHVYNEYMAADVDGTRVATFPDFMGTLDPATGEPVAINELSEGIETVVIACSKRSYPIGADALNPDVYPEVEGPLGIDLKRWALDPNA